VRRAHPAEYEVPFVLPDTALQATADNDFDVELEASAHHSGRGSSTHNPLTKRCKLTSQASSSGTHSTPASQVPTLKEMQQLLSMDAGWQMH
jgi:hypothetical protein